MASDVRRIVLVGHCVPDAMALRSAIRSALGDVEVVTANDSASLEAALGGSALLLVNRVLDGRFGRESGQSLVKRLAADGERVMLISNYEEAQSEAVASGACAGFGKQDLYTEEMRERLESALA